jgi:TolB-like protein/DNA-binding winged helix-turn-helix (wHTH) protein/tetratricopeptide (TPR) repeat protein
MRVGSVFHYLRSARQRCAGWPAGAAIVANRKTPLSAARLGTVNRSKIHSLRDSIHIECGGGSRCRRRHARCKLGVSDSSGQDPMKYSIADLTIDTGRQLVSRADISIQLPKLSYDLLLALVGAAPNLVSLDELMRLVWPGVVVSPETVSQRIKLLRGALEDDPREPRYIAGLRGRGYHLVPAVKQFPDSPVASGLAAMSPEPERLPPVPGESAIAPERVAICVLPFANMSGDPEQAYFSDGITEDVITELSRWRLLAVRSRSASFRYRGAEVDTKQVARELNVRFVVEGSVRRIGTRIRINAQLIDNDTGRHIWAERFDRESAQLFEVQDQVVQTIVSTLVGRVHASDVERARRKPSASLAAYECVLKGNALPWDDAKGLAEATRLFEKAIEIDPGYGHAHALLAAICCTEWQDDPSSSDAHLHRAFALANRAVELDENESTCFSMLGWAHLLRRSYDLALHYTRRAVEMNPNNQWNAADMGTILLYLGQAEEALAWLKRAKDIDPFFNEPWYWRSIGFAYTILRRYPEALTAFDYLPIQPHRVLAYRAGCYARLAAIDQARASAAECLALKPEFSIAHFLTKQPFKNPADAASLAESMRMAGLPD